MPIKDLWKIFVRDNENDNDNENTEQEEDSYYTPDEKASGSGNEDGTAFRGLRRREAAPDPIINEVTDERVEDVIDDDDPKDASVIVPGPIDMPEPEEDAGEGDAKAEEDTPAEEEKETDSAGEYDPFGDDNFNYGYTDKSCPEKTDDAFVSAEAPEFKLVHIKNLALARHAVDLFAKGYVVIADTSCLEGDMIGMLTCFIAGAVYALGGNIYPADETNAFLSLAEFDPTPYLPAEEEEEASAEPSAD